MKRHLAALSTAIALSGLVSCGGSAPPARSTPPQAAPKPKYKKPVRMNDRGKVSSISITKAFELQQSGHVLIYDARPAGFHAISHIPGALSLPKENCDEHIAAAEAALKAAIAANKPILVYCTGFLCADAHTVAKHLAGFGYSSSVIEGGWDSWTAANLPTEPISKP